MSGWVNDLITQMINGVLNTITSATLSALNWVLGLLSDTIFHSPDITLVPQVAYMSGRAQLVANACMTMTVVIVGLIAMTNGTVQDRYSLKELLPRMLVGFAVANLANPIIRVVLSGANAITQALAGGPLTQDSFNEIKRTIADVTGDPLQFLVATVLRLMIMVMLVFLVITWLGRLSVLLVVAGTAPVALMCHALPWAEPVARLWWRSLLSCVAVQILQAVTLHIAVAAMLVPGANAAALGLPHDPTGLFNMLIACFLLWLVIRIPTWVARNFSGGNAGRGASMLGSIVRVVVVQQLLGAIGLRGGGRKRAGRAGARAAVGGAAGPRTPANHFHQHANAHQHLHQHVHLHPPGGGRGATTGRPGGPSTAPPRRGAYWAGDVTPRTHPGRPPMALEGRPAGPPRALGSGRR